MPDFVPTPQPLTLSGGYTCSVLRIDLLDPEISGNKWFKLKHNLERAKKEGRTTLLTFGGAYSNHIAATAAAARRFGFKSIGVIRGEKNINPTLLEAEKNGMLLHFVSREDYRKKDSTVFIETLRNRFGDFYLVPEGGNNAEGIQGCMEILNGIIPYDYVCCACGTGATFAGLAASAGSATKVIGISVLKGANRLPSDVNNMLSGAGIGPLSIAGNEALLSGDNNTHLISNLYCFSGYGAYDEELVAFKTNWEQQHEIPLDHVYTAKLAFAVEDLMKKNFFKPGSRILLIHSGGLQGNAGFEARYQRSPIW